jgi:Zn/Cd-binding protein ZinT
VELFKLGVMKPLDIKHMPHNSLQPPPIPDLAYNPKHCLNRVNSIKAKAATIDDVRRDPRQSPKYGWQMLSKVLNGCAAVSGVVKSFNKQALHGARIWGVAGTYDDLTILDINSLYPYAMTKVSVPYGAPQICDARTDLRRAAYYIVEVMVNAVQPHSYYRVLPAIGTTQCYDKIDLEEMSKYCGMKYTVVRGYYWTKSAQDRSMADFVHGLYNQRLNAANKEDAKMYKFILTHSFGETMAKGFDTLKSRRFETKKEFLTYMNKYQHRIAQINVNEHVVRIHKTYDHSFNFNYVGCMILSMSRRIVNRYMDKFAALNVPVYIHNTDSFAIPTADVEKVRDMIGAGLGMLKLEQSGRNVVVLRGNAYWFSDQYYRYTGMTHAKINEQPNIREFYLAQLGGITA